MHINDYKLAYAQRSLQVVLFDGNGAVAASCNTFITIEPHTQQSVFELFAFLDGIRQQLLGLLPDGTEYHFPRVNFTHQQREWFTDNTFFRSPHQPELIVWVMSHFDQDRNYLLHIQQERNELMIQHSSRDARQQLHHQLHKNLSELETVALYLQNYVGNLYLTELNQTIANTKLLALRLTTSSSEMVANE